MFRYIARDFKNALHRRYTYAYVIGIFALCLIANISVVAFRMVYGTNEGTYAYNILNYTTWCFVVPYYSCMFIADMGFGKVYPNPQIKDKITKDMSRYRDKSNGLPFQMMEKKDNAFCIVINNRSHHFA